MPVVSSLTADLVNLTKFMSSEETKDIVARHNFNQQNSGCEIILSECFKNIHHLVKLAPTNTSGGFSSIV